MTKKTTTAPAAAKAATPPAANTGADHAAIVAAQDAGVKSQNEALEANSPLEAPSSAERAEAQAEGIKEAIAEKAKDQFNYLTDGNLPGAPPKRSWPGKSDIMRYAHLIDLGINQFQEVIREDAPMPIPEEKVAGLLELERSGKNRTQYVQALMARLGVESPYEVTDAGPDYTNDGHSVTKL